MNPQFSLLCAVVILIITNFQNLIYGAVLDAIKSKGVTEKYTANFYVDTAGLMIENIEVCDEKSGVIKYLKYEKMNRTATALSLKMILTSPIDSHVGLKIEAEKWSSSGWTKVPYLPVIPDACNTINRFYSQYMTDFWRTSGVKNPDKCPIPPGEYTVNNFIFSSKTNNDQTKVPVKGRVRLTTSLIDMPTNKVILCVNIYMQS